MYKILLPFIILSFFYNNYSAASSLHIKIINNNLSNLYKKQKYLLDSGYDLYASDNVTILPNEIKKINFGIVAQVVGKKHGFLIMNRSSIKNNPTLLLVPQVGVIDYEFIGELGSYVINLSNHTKTISEGESYWQIVFPNLEPVNVKYVNSIEQRKRGNSGFGSTNKN